MPCATYGGAIVCGSPTREVVNKPDGDRWCFACRKRVEFRYVVIDDVEPSYYDPVPSIRRTNGHHDGDLFPGRVRDWWGEFADA